MGKQNSIRNAKLCSRTFVWFKTYLEQDTYSVGLAANKNNKGYRKHKNYDS